ncbi:MAG: hypothetical protein NTV51_08515, partial [Verrucomicrobia bacterium]|nr:hypothetical protein [Verrucomicrobiota bacterium]
FLAGNSTLTNQSTGVLRVLDVPLTASDSNYNAIRATGLSVVNAGTMTIGALTAQPANNNAAFPWFYLDRSLTNSGSLTLLQSAQLIVEGAFSNAGSVVLNNRAQLSALGGGTQTGTFALGSDPESRVWFKGATTVNDLGTMFSGNGYVIMEGGTLHTAGGTYTPTVNLELAGGVALPEATTLQPASGHWLRISGDVPALPVRVVSGAELQVTGGTNTHHITVESGGNATLGGTATLNAVAGQPGRGDIDNHGTVTLGIVGGTGRLLNHADGTVVGSSNNGVVATSGPFLEIVNDGLLNLTLQDNDPNPLHSNTFQGTMRTGDGGDHDDRDDSL